MIRSQIILGLGKVAISAALFKSNETYAGIKFSNLNGNYKSGDPVTEFNDIDDSQSVFVVVPNLKSLEGIENACAKLRKKLEAEAKNENN